VTVYAVRTACKHNIPAYVLNADEYRSSKVCKNTQGHCFSRIFYALDTASSVRVKIMKTLLKLITDNNSNKMPKNNSNKMLTQVFAESVDSCINSIHLTDGVLVPR